MYLWNFEQITVYPTASKEIDLFVTQRWRTWKNISNPHVLYLWQVTSLSWVSICVTNVKKKNVRKYPN